MVILNRPTIESDVFVVGGGPAGLAAALAVRRAGYSVVLADRARPPIDKACGEGLMPDGITALRHLGIELGAEQGIPFRGIRFVDHGRTGEGSFPNGFGLGIRRTALHRILMRHAADAGVITYWQAQLDDTDPSALKLGNQSVRSRWIIGADGAQSRVRQWAGLKPVWTGARRVGLRQHFRVRPWTDHVEVHWDKGSQAYVTPVAADEVCIAILCRAQKESFTDLIKRFPDLTKRLEHAKPIGTVRGAISMSTELQNVTRGSIALIGDASGAADAVTGEGVSLAFRQAAILGTALGADDLGQYEKMHRRISRVPRLMARSLIFIGEHDRIRQHALGALAAQPLAFDHLLAVHVSARHPARLLFDGLGLALRSLRSGAAAGAQLLSS